MSTLSAVAIQRNNLPPESGQNSSLGDVTVSTTVVGTGVGQNCPEIIPTASYSTIGLFRVHVCLLFKASLSAKFFL